MGTKPLAVLSIVLIAAVQVHASEESRLTAIARSSSHFVAVGRDGAILRSEDGRAWSNQPAVTQAHLRGVAFGDGRFVAVGDAGTLVTGTDTAGWQRLDPLDSNTLRQVTFGRGQFIAVGDSGTILSSMDGLHWRRLRSTTTAKLRSVVYGSGRFVAVGEGGIIVTSSGGYKAWSCVNSGTESCLRGVAYGNGVFVAVAPNRAVFTSGDGLRWIRHSATDDAYLYALCFNGREFVAVGCTGRAAWSSDGQIWRPIEKAGCGDLVGVAGTTERMVGVGGTGTTLFPSPEPAVPVLTLKTPKSRIDGSREFLDK